MVERRGRTLGRIRSWRRSRSRGRFYFRRAGGKLGEQGRIGNQERGGGGLTIPVTLLPMKFDGWTLLSLAMRK